LLEGIELCVVDMITWNKKRMGMGYRSRRTSEHLVVLQRPYKRSPKLRAKGVWNDHAIPDVWDEKVNTSIHPHTKPHALQVRLIRALTKPGDVVLDPCAGGYSVLRACVEAERDFLGCDLLEAAL